MVFCLIVALFATLVYINLILSDSINLRVNPAMAASKNDNDAVRVAKLKYFLILLMSVFWSLTINFLLKR